MSELKAEFIKWDQRGTLEANENNLKEIRLGIIGIPCSACCRIEFPSVCFNYNYALPEGMRMSRVEVYEGDLLNIYCTTNGDHNHITGFIRVRPA